MSSSVEEKLLKLSADFRNWCEKVALVPPAAWTTAGPARASVARAALPANAPLIHAPDHVSGTGTAEPTGNAGEAADEAGFEQQGDILVRYFNQTKDFPWMRMKVAARDRGREVSRFPLTEEGVCAALTCHYMRMHLQGTDGSFFDWIRTPGGISSVMNDQLVYEGYRRGRMGIRLQETAAPDFRGVMGGLLEEAGLRHQLTSPDRDFDTDEFVNSVSAIDPQSGNACLYRLINLDLGDSKHSVGAIIDTERGDYTFIDTNLGVFKTDSIDRFEVILERAADMAYDDVVSFTTLTFLDDRIGLAGMNL